MEFIFDNWLLLVVFGAMVVASVVIVIRFWRLPTEDQIAAAKEWLLGVVIEAERELGSGTGVLKLRYVYDLFVDRFPWLAKVIPFKTFALWVDESLDVMHELLAQNKKVKLYVGGGDDAQ